MKVSRIRVTVFISLLSLGAAAPVRAQGNANFVKNFLARYRSPNLVFPATPDVAAQQALPDAVRAGQLPLTMGEFVNLMLQNNLDVGVVRLTPLSSMYTAQTMYKPFEPTIHLKATVGRNTTPATSFLSGASAPSTLSGSYNIG